MRLYRCGVTRPPDLDELRHSERVRVLLTGGSGFIGSYTVPALRARGHDVRLLVRNPDKARTVLARRGVEPDEVELVVGDMLDADVVGPAAEGCAATIHAAAAIGMTGHGEVSLLEQNTVGARTVVGAAIAAGHDPIVHVSSVAIFVPPREPTIRAESPLANPRTEYGRSKLLTEQELRRLQADGAPITIVYPGGVIGPDQPSLDTTAEGLVAARTQGWPRTAGWRVPRRRPRPGDGAGGDRRGGCRTAPVSCSAAASSCGPTSVRCSTS